jgi:hypothetical protein
MTLSQNGWPALPPDSHLLRTITIPAKNGTFRLRVRDGSAGFLLAHYAMFHSESIEDVSGKVVDDWGYADRLIRGSTSEVSNHGSGTAIDLNAITHQLGKFGTYSSQQERRIHSRLRWMRGVIRWGGDYQGRKDEMHFEVVQSLAAAEREARRLMRSPRGRRILKANPGLKAVILS